MYQNLACPSTLVGYPANVDKGRRVFQGQWKVATDQKPEMIMVQKEMQARKLACRQNLSVMTTMFLDVAIFPNDSLQIRQAKLLPI